LPAVRLELPRLQVDAAACAEHRVLIGADSDLYSSVSDAYRMIRTRLLYRLETHGWNSLAVTSAGPQEGKSVTVLNLGFAIAKEKKRNVFLLDLDLRNPSLCQYLGVQPTTGIGDYLAGSGKIEDVLFTVGGETLAVAGGFTKHENSTELLGGERFSELLGHIRKLDPNALIIADLPPVLSVADAMVVAPKLSATLVVVAVGKTRRDGLARALEVLGGATMAGVVLNQSREAVQNYYG
jgi:protein-tyrosine kinase